MRIRMIVLVVVGIFTALGLVSRARAADHRDGPRVVADPSIDIADVYSWMPDPNHVALIMNVYPGATPSSKFSTSAKYVLHTASFTQYPGTADPEINIICTFDGAATQNVSCWVGQQEYVHGDATSVVLGLSSADGKVQVFTGLRDDPFFYNLGGFQDMRTTLKNAISGGGLTFDAAGCPSITNAVSAQLVNQLTHTNMGTMPPLDSFAQANVLSIVLKVDKSLLLSNGHTVLGVWGSTNL